MNSIVFTNKPQSLGGHGLNVLIQKYCSEECTQIYQFSLKAKQQKAIQLPKVFLKFVKNLFLFVSSFS